MLRTRAERTTVGIRVERTTESKRFQSFFNGIFSKKKTKAPNFFLRICRNPFIFVVLDKMLVFFPNGIFLI